MDLDKNNAWKRGVEEREAIAHHEAAQLKIAGELALNEVNTRSQHGISGDNSETYVSVMITAGQGIGKRYIGYCQEESPYRA